jgi:hypothetical protein
MSGLLEEKDADASMVRKPLGPRDRLGTLPEETTVPLLPLLVTVAMEEEEDEEEEEEKKDEEEEASNSSGVRFGCERCSAGSTTTISSGHTLSTGVAVSRSSSQSDEPDAEFMRPIAPSRVAGATATAAGAEAVVTTAAAGVDGPVVVVVAVEGEEEEEEEDEEEEEEKARVAGPVEHEEDHTPTPARPMPSPGVLPLPKLRSTARVGGTNRPSRVLSAVAPPPVMVLKLPPPLPLPLPLPLTLPLPLLLPPLLLPLLLWLLLLVRRWVCGKAMGPQSTPTVVVGEIRMLAMDSAIAATRGCCCCCEDGGAAPSSVGVGGGCARAELRST